MNEQSQGTALDRIASGDPSALEVLKRLPPDVPLSSAHPLVVDANAVVRVLEALLDASVAPMDAQAWASFVRRGYLPGGTGPIRALAIDYAPEDEEWIVETVSRLDEIGDRIDGDLGDDEIRALINMRPKAWLKTPSGLPRLGPPRSVPILDLRYFSRLALIAIRSLTKKLEGKVGSSA